VFRNLTCNRLELDEIWTFCFAKQKNVREEHQDEFGYGDVYTWVSIDAETKLVPAWYVGRRDGHCAYEFIKDLSERLANRVQLTTDGFKAYLNPIEEIFGTEIAYAMLIKVYGGSQEETRYSRAECLGTLKERIMGHPDPELGSTSYVERQNLMMRMCMRRFTRLTIAPSKKIENHIHAIALPYMYYNFAPIHSSSLLTRNGRWC